VSVTEYVILSLNAANLRLSGAELAVMVRRARATLTRDGAIAMRLQLANTLRQRLQSIGQVIDGFRIEAVIVH
jgi:hypothetical protein